MMNDPQKSDGCTVAMKSANKPDGSGAESMERRWPAKGNADESCTHRTLSRGSVTQGLDRVRERAKSRKEERFTALLHHVDVERLRRAYFALKRNASPGIDGTTWQRYGQALEANLTGLHGRIHRGAYRALPSKRQYIPKADGRQRPLAICALEDKIVQRAVAAVLNAIYEEDFRGFSYGFRPKRNQHDALDALIVGITTTKVNWILEVDIRSFFDEVNRDWLGRFLEHRIADPRILHLIQKWLKAGVLEDGVVTDSEKGTGQGTVITPRTQKVTSALNV